jgi:predicted ArsR family transcriptional regulator
MLRNRSVGGSRNVFEEAARPHVSHWLEVIADPVRLSILRSLSEIPEATTAELATRGSASNQTLRRHLEALVALGVIEEHPPRSDGERPGRPATRFSLTLAVRESARSLFGSAAGPVRAVAAGRLDLSDRL